MALLYSTVIGAKRRVRADDLLGVAERLGLCAPRVVLSSGNLVFTADSSEPALVRLISAEIAALYGRDVPVLVRSQADWQNLVASNPFPDQSASSPQNTAVRIMAAQPGAALMQRLSAKAQPGDLLAPGDRAIWAYSAGAVEKSTLMRAVNARWAGVGTMRNASAVQKILSGFD